MTKAGSRGERSRAKIILAAEKLFARQGFEGVSIREIGAEAGQANSNAVQYHFGTKNGLLHAIFEYRVGHMDLARRALLKHAESQGRLQDMRTLVDILLLPYLDLTDEEGKHNYAVVMNEYMTRYRPRGVPHAGDELKKGTESLRYLLSLIQRRIDYLPAQIAQSRLALCHLMFFNTLVMWDNDQTPMAQRAPLRSLIEDTLQIVTIAFCLPDPNPMNWQGKIGTDADARDGVLTWGELSE